MEDCYFVSLLNVKYFLIILALCYYWLIMCKITHVENHAYLK